MIIKIKSTGQIRAARALLRWSAQDLADTASLGVATIRRIETLEGTPLTHVRTLLAIQSALESAGVEFIDRDDGSAGVLLRQSD